MNRDDKIREEVSEERLGALIDSELDPAEFERLYARIETDERLAQRVCLARGMKDMLRMAYAAPPGMPAGGWQAWGAGGRRFGRALAAGVLLAVGAGTGLLMHSGQQDGAVADAGGAALGEPIRLAALAGSDKLLLHIDHASPRDFDTLLDRVESLLREAREHRTNLRVEIVTNYYGIDLLRADRSVAVQRIAALARAHENLSLVACGQTVARFTREEGHAIRLLPEAHVAPTAIGEIVTRLQQGWTYIKV